MITRTLGLIASLASMGMGAFVYLKPQITTRRGFFGCFGHKGKEEWLNERLMKLCQGKKKKAKTYLNFLLGKTLVRLHSYYKFSFPWMPSTISF